ncbi:hypothetical protein A9G11_08015 [Gilliamella sp. wkB108]|uniref:hypothetical protein n=1 Tax=Gilliamella sp. wkB108 TaxID=3120256 RepID=UPI00080E1187|nr:hypothetical protein [Gilliamella apicola]OCG21609.1 hypothetical protein A9G11_08015 [Gilliamella apicola]
MIEYFTVLNIVTYHIYHDGEIEKHIPQRITIGFEKKYKYIYHDKDDNEHEVCIVDWHETNEKKIGKKSTVLSTKESIISDVNISEGQTTRRIRYKNGDIAEYGSNNGNTFWVLYKAKIDNIQLVRMPDELNYTYNGIKIKYNFYNSERKYTCPGALTGFIGALAETGLKIVTTGSCFVYASYFPSVEHINGKSIDTLYLNDADEQKFINAMHKFNFNKQITGKHKKKFDNAIQESKGTLHDSHLHSGFDESLIKVIKT